VPSVHPNTASETRGPNGSKRELYYPPVGSPWSRVPTRYRPSDVRAKRTVRSQGIRSFQTLPSLGSACDGSSPPLVPQLNYSEDDYQGPTKMNGAAAETEGHTDGGGPPHHGAVVQSAKFRWYARSPLTAKATQ
jgi:hypothetical protein